MNVKTWIYRCDAGEYWSDSLLGLLWDLLTHRFEHWRRGDGWRD
jgi:hypothetical protein